MPPDVGHWAGECAMGVELFRAQSEHDQEELFRFRYAVYVEELGRYRQSADHRGRRLVEPEDAHSVLYGARQGGHVVGTARLTFGADGLSHRQIDQYSLGHFLAEVPAERSAVGARIMVLRAHRSSTVLAELRYFVHVEISARGARMIFGACEPH